MGRRKTEEDYRNVGKTKGITWVGEELPKNVSTKTLWKCKFEHRWLTRYSVIYEGYGCPFCSHSKKRKTAQDYYNIGINKGIKWVGSFLPKNNRVKTLWECKKGHKFKTRYNTIQQDHGCPICNKKVEQDYNKLAKEKKFKWLGKELPKNAYTLTLWKCSEDHTFEARYSSVQQGSGCPFCAGNIKKTKQDYQELAKEKSIVWISKNLPKDINTNTVWKCIKSNHVFKSSYKNTQKGRGCPRCGYTINGVNVSKPQRRLNKMLHGSLNYPEARYRIDVAIMRNSQKIVVEYDCWYWHQGNEEHDEKRDKFLISCGWKVLHIKSGRLLPTRKQLKQAIKELLNGKDIVYIYLKDWKI